MQFPNNASSFLLLSLSQHQLSHPPHLPFLCMSKLPSSSNSAHWILLREVCSLCSFTQIWNPLLFLRPSKLTLYFITQDRKGLIKGRPGYWHAVSEGRERVATGESPRLHRRGPVSFWSRSPTGGISDLDSHFTATYLPPCSGYALG